MIGISQILANSEKITSIDKFSAVISERGMLVRIVGELPEVFEQLYAMDREHHELMNNNRCVYRRIKGLSKTISYDDSQYYLRAYNEWVKSGKTAANTKCTDVYGYLSQMLGEACGEAVNKYCLYREGADEAVIKNFVIRAFCWYDEIMGDIISKKGFHISAKIVADNIVKPQEYLFFYMLALTGINVLLVQNRQDISLDLKKLDISRGKILAHLGTQQIAEDNFIPESSSGRESSYRSTSDVQHRNTSAQRQNTSSQTQQKPSIKVVIPPRDRTSRKPYKNNPVSATERQGRPSYNMPDPARHGNTVFMPQNNRSSYNMPDPARQGNTVFMPQNNRQSVSVNLPPHPGRQSSPPVTAPGRSDFYTSSRNNFDSAYTSAPSMPEKSYEELARCAASVVQIMVYRSTAVDFYGESRPFASGSGIMIGTSGYILTNCHVAKQGTAFGVKLENDNRIYYTNAFIKYHRDLDLALLRIDKRITPLPVYNGTKPLERGQRVVAIGSPMGMFNSVSDGIISGFRNINGVDMIQFTAPISAGSSGGALLNMYGEVIGISTAGVSTGQNLNLAVPYTAINNFCSGFMNR